jgi:hypothetical protein
VSSAARVITECVVTWRPGKLPIGQTAKARSGYRVQSLQSGRDRQYEINPISNPLAEMVRIDRLDAVLGLGF